MLEVMRCLAKELNAMPADSKAHQILKFMVESKLMALEQGREEQLFFERPKLLVAVEGKLRADALDPARWLTNGLLEQFLDSRKVSLLARLRNAGLKHRPVIGSNDSKGGKGIQRTYWLDVEAIPPDELGEQVLDFERIEYRRTEAGEVKPSWLLRMVFSNGELKNRSGRGLSLLILVLLGMAFWGLYLLAGFWRVSGLSEPITLRQLIEIAFIALCSWFVWKNFFRPWIELVDHRVVKAPQTMLAFGEDEAEIEMHCDSAKNQWTRFVRFTGDCPLCSGRVLLMPGKPEHSLPLVGRCSESPHAHVFSFDRTRLSGVYVGPRSE
ncbi:hypothetical protein [Pseudomonas sp. N040]|uniref:hypothetical protein n=1 Tax=Pseudomonas sp. N040 TaxID=2785325 RepID=UPI0018A2F2A9|nr:hypothetical protein [Pseudomonas sp. N040]MBF7731106.1 hypothetical protein [Pseudomonas sp. N040]MBW7014749.1 hypothetical protein [Pseudomonas sp. N040]